MATYTYECKKCKTLSDITKPMEFSGSPETCGNCGRLMIRYYQLAQVRRDTYSRNVEQSYYHPVNGPKMGKPDVIGSRSEEKAWLKAYNARHGTNLVRD